MLTEVEELKKSNDKLVSKVNDLENQMQTLEYVNQEFATQGWQLEQKIKTLEDQLKPQHLEPMVVIHLKSKSMPLVKSVLPAKSVSPTKSISPAKSVSPEKFISSDSENSESVEE